MPIVVVNRMFCHSIKLVRKVSKLDTSGVLRFRRSAWSLFVRGQKRALEALMTLTPSPDGRDVGWVRDANLRVGPAHATMCDVRRFSLALVLLAAPACHSNEM